MDERKRFYLAQARAIHALGDPISGDRAAKLMIEGGIIKAPNHAAKNWLPRASLFFSSIGHEARVDTGLKFVTGEDVMPCLPTRPRCEEGSTEARIMPRSAPISG